MSFPGWMGHVHTTLTWDYRCQGSRTLVGSFTCEKWTLQNGKRLVQRSKVRRNLCFSDGAGYNESEWLTHEAALATRVTYYDGSAFAWLELPSTVQRQPQLLLSLCFDRASL